eukprot:358899-Chlamydomonas_euryale.AAC.2
MMVADGSLHLLCLTRHAGPSKTRCGLGCAGGTETGLPDRVRFATEGATLWTSCCRVTPASLCRSICSLPQWSASRITLGASSQLAALQSWPCRPHTRRPHPRRPYPLSTPRTVNIRRPHLPFTPAGRARPRRRGEHDADRAGPLAHPDGRQGPRGRDARSA